MKFIIVSKFVGDDSLCLIPLDTVTCIDLRKGEASVTDKTGKTYYIYDAMDLSDISQSVIEL